MKGIQQNNILYEMIIAYEFHEWILSCHNKNWTFVVL